MATAAWSSSTGISAISGYCGYAEARVGSNGDDLGDPELCLGHDEIDNEFGRRIWDTQLSNGFDTGWVSLQLEAAQGGGTDGLALTVFGGETVNLNYSGVSYGNITQVKIRAAVAIAAKMQWRNVSVKFYKNGVVNDSYSVTSGPTVDKSGQSGAVSGEQILTVIPAANDNTKLVVTGDVRLVKSGTSLPDVCDLFGQIFVFTSFCS